MNAEVENPSPGMTRGFVKTSNFLKGKFIMTHRNIKFNPHFHGGLAYDN